MTYLRPIKHPESKNKKELSELEVQRVSEYYFSFKSAKSLKQYKTKINKLVRRDTGEFRGLGPQAIQERILELDDYSPNHRNNHIKVLKNFYKFLRVTGIATSMPIEFLKQGRAYAVNHEPLDAKHIETILEYEDMYYRRDEDSRMFKFILFQLYTGCRSSEALNAKEIGIKHLDNGKARLIIYGKGGKIRRLIVTAQVARLARRLKNCKISSQSMRTYQRRFDNFWRDHLKPLGVPRFTSHQLRATAASNWYRSGLSIEKVSALLGHSSVDITRGYIADLNNGASHPLPEIDELYKVGHGSVDYQVVNK